MGRGSTLLEVWKKSISILMSDFEGFMTLVEVTLVEAVTADVVERARELELEADSEDVTELLQSHDKTLKDEELILIDEQRNQFLEMEFTPGEEAMRIVEMTKEDLDYYTNLVDKALNRV